MKNNSKTIVSDSESYTFLVQAKVSAKQNEMIAELAKNSRRGIADYVRLLIEYAHSHKLKF